MTRVVSVALFGDVVPYHRYLPAAIRAHHNLYPGWQFRIHHDGRQGPYSGALRMLGERGLVELVYVADNPPAMRAMLWRLLPLWDDSVDRFLVRDIDAMPGFRERRAVEVWIRSGLAAHSMSDKRGAHDHPALGGMMGFKVQQARRLIGCESFDELLSRARYVPRAGGCYPWAKEHWEGHLRVGSMTANDQSFLGDYVWPYVQKHACEHRLSGSRTFGAAQTHTEIDELEKDGLGVDKDIREGADRFVPLIGSSDFEVDAAINFYKVNGDQTIEAVIAECEAA